MQGEIRVTVIATGFDRAVQTGMAGHGGEAPTVGKPTPTATPVIPFPAQRPARTSGPLGRGSAPESTRRPGQGPSQGQDKTGGTQDLNDMEIPTFIRRQMD
jgi:cell division protein FtsZ